jgi:hypothetical protein
MDQRTCHHNVDGNLIRIKVSISIEFSLSAITSRRVGWQHTCSHLSDVIRQQDILSVDHSRPSVEHLTFAAREDSRKYLPLGSPRLPLMSLCMLVRTLKKSASRRSMARAKEVTDSTAAGSESSQQSRIVCCVVLCCVALLSLSSGLIRMQQKRR